MSFSFGVERDICTIIKLLCVLINLLQISQHDYCTYCSESLLNDKCKLHVTLVGLICDINSTEMVEDLTWCSINYILLGLLQHICGSYCELDAHGDTIKL